MDIYKNHFGNDHLNLVFDSEQVKGEKMDLLLYALNYLKTQSIFFNLTILGKVETNYQSTRFVQKLGIEDYVWFYGACSDEQHMNELILNADFYISSEIWFNAENYKQLAQCILHKFVFRPETLNYSTLYRNFVDVYFNLESQFHLNEAYNYSTM